MRTLRSALIPAVAVVMALLSFGGIATAQDSPPVTTQPPGGTTTVPGGTTTVPGGTTTVPGGTTTVPGGTTIPGSTTAVTPTTRVTDGRVGDDDLPRTGEDIIPAVLLGAAMVAVGVALLLRVRQRLHRPFAV